ncbi:FliM/FliN family flagellar motor switch protein [Falsihalocynthiibacter sp. SS001]|uniref:FliM/FliN family flagellar motor switch protein n=1 Tax=Falsihalocynthiibacter sp. SS001 TaxID=3349698 RepID=UPI0036D344A7
MDEYSASEMGANPFSNVPVTITVAVGKARPLIKDLLTMGQNAVLELDRKIDEPVELFVGDRLLAKGELVELDGEKTGQLAVRLTEVVDIRNGR